MRLTHADAHASDIVQRGKVQMSEEEGRTEESGSRNGERGRGKREEGREEWEPERAVG